MEKSAVPLISTRGCGGFLWAEFRFSLSSPSFIALTFLPSPANLRKTPLGAQATSGWQVSALWEGEACGGRCHAAHWSCIQCGVSSLLASSQSPSSLALPWVFELSKGGKRIVFWCGCLTFELSWGPVRSLLSFHSSFSSSLGMLSVCGVLSWAAGSLPLGTVACGRTAQDVFPHSTVVHLLTACLLTLKNAGAHPSILFPSVPYAH